METITTDVLVIGGGGAGMRAALSARKEGSKVCLVAKAPIGKSTCTYLSGGTFSLAADGVSQDKHIELTLKAGKEINERTLVEVFVEDAPKRVREMEQLGLLGEWHKGRFLCLGRAPAWGAPLANLLAQEVTKERIDVIPWVIIYELLLENGEIAGAMGMDYHRGKAVRFLSRAVILANGGAGALYKRHDNPVRITGDGYALAFRAGCSLRDMEFVQFNPIATAVPGKPTFLLGASLAESGRIVNSNDENIIEKYKITERPVAAKSRDSLSIAIFLEEAEGREVFMDLRDLTKESWPKDNMAHSLRNILFKNFNCDEKPLRISGVCHFFMGGVCADINGATEVPGLFAAGEVVGGVHGANRMAGNALGEILVFGHRAGLSAAHFAMEKSLQQPSKIIFTEPLEAWVQQKGISPKGVKLQILRKVIGEILWNKGGIVRDGKGMTQALAALEKIRDTELPNVKMENPKEVLEKLEMKNALLVAEMILRSALFRKESRGSHFRKDYSKADDRNWKGNIFLKKSDSTMHLNYRPIY